MTAPRAEFTATVLRDGKILIAGGFNLHAPVGLASAEIYDPKTDRWTRAASMAAPRYGQTATLLKSGDVLLAGGTPSKRAELYNPHANSWRPAGNMLYPCRGGFATLVSDDDVLVSGCAGERPQIYHASTNTWSAAGSPTAELRGGGAALLTTGEVLLFGGYNDALTGDAQYLPSTVAEVYSPATNAWRTVAPMSAGLASPAVVALKGGDVLVAGGATGGYGNVNVVSAAELYSPSTNRWTPTASMPLGQASTISAILPNGKVFVAGGLTSVNPNNGNATAPPSANAEIYNPTTRSWSAISEMSTGRYLAAAVALPSGRVLVFGGISSFGHNKPSVVASAEIYAP